MTQLGPWPAKARSRLAGFSWLTGAQEEAGAGAIIHSKIGIDCVLSREISWSCQVWNRILGLLYHVHLICTEDWGLEGCLRHVLARRQAVPHIGNIHDADMQHIHVCTM